MKAVRVLFVVCILMVVAAALCAQYIQPKGVDTSRQQISVSVKTNKQTYATGEPVDLLLALVNNTDQTLSYELTSLPAHDFWITSADGAEVWRFSTGKIHSERSELKIDPHQWKVYSETWNQRTNRGQSVDPGYYEVYGKFSMDHSDKIIHTRIQITDKSNSGPMTLMVPVNAGTIDPRNDVGQPITIQGVLRQGSQGLYVETTDVKVRRNSH